MKIVRALVVIRKSDMRIRHHFSNFYCALQSRGLWCRDNLKYSMLSFLYMMKNYWLYKGDSEYLHNRSIKIQNSIQRTSQNPANTK